MCLLTIVASEGLHDTTGEQLPLPVVLYLDHEGHGPVLVLEPVSHRPGHVKADPSLGDSVLHHRVQHHLGGGADAGVAELQPEHRDPQLALPAQAELVQAELGGVHLDLGARSVARESDFIEEDVNFWILGTLQQKSLFSSDVTCRMTSQDWSLPMKLYPKKNSQVGKKLCTLSVYSTEKGSLALGGERVDTLQSGRSGSCFTLALTSSPVGITLLAQLNCCSM